MKLYLYLVLLVLMTVISACGDDEPEKSSSDNNTSNNVNNSRDSSMLTCSELGACFAICEDNEQTCTDACIDAATIEAVTLMTAVLECSNECQVPGSDDCLENECGPETRACQADE